MLISEIFLSIDGEGVRAGYPVVFIRTVGCPLRCSYCDTSYAFEADETTQNLSIDEIVKKCNSFGINRVTITGGEPLIQKQITELIETLINNKYEVNIETSGAIYYDIRELDSVLLYYAWLDGRLFFTYDYKCPISSMQDKMEKRIFQNLGPYDLVKFVVGSQEDLDFMGTKIKEIEKYNSGYVFSTCLNRYYVSPVFGKIEPKDIVTYLCDNKIQNVRLQLQLHKFIWEPTKRGV